MDDRGDRDLQLQHQDRRRGNLLPRRLDVLRTQRMVGSRDDDDGVPPMRVHDR